MLEVEWGFFGLKASLPTGLSFLIQSFSVLFFFAVLLYFLNCTSRSQNSLLRMEENPRLQGLQFNHQRQRAGG
jgi:hypothetical protein